MTKQRFSSRLRVTIVAAVVLIAASFGLVVASNLSLSGPTQPWVSLVSRCTDQQIDVTIQDGFASFTLPEACIGENASLHVATGTGTTSYPLIGELENAVPIGDIVPSPGGVLVTASTWPLSTTATVSDPGPDPEPVPASPITCTIPDGECTVTTKTYNAWTEGGIQKYQLYVELTSTSDTPQVWTATINLSSPDLAFLANAVQNHQPGGLVNVTTSGCTATPRTITVQGNANWSKDKIGGGLKAEIDIQGRSSGSGDLLTCP